jgi:hypothetical protein
MKRVLIISAALALICGVSYASYHFGFRRGYYRALILQNGTFVGSLSALDQLRAGNINSGTEQIEAICFSSANVVYGDFVFRKGWGGKFDGKTMLDDLRHYRQTYRTNSADWTPLERTLERNLAAWK